MKPLNKIKDFPRGRRLEECTDATPVVSSLWTLTPEEAKAISDKLGGQSIETVRISRNYKPEHLVGLVGAKAPSLDAANAKKVIRKLEPVITGFADTASDDAKKQNIIGAKDKLVATNEQLGSPKVWAAAFVEAAAAVRARLGEATIVVSDALDEPLAEFEELAKDIVTYDARHGEARTLVASWIPTFIFTPEFPELHGHQNLEQYVNQRGQNPSLVEAENNFAKLAKVADFDPAQLHAHREDHEMRSQTLNRAGALVTQAIRRLWKDRALTVRFNLDGIHCDILISDPNANYPVEVNLDERSRGFRWFFSFYTTFSADTQGGNADGAILLLDEPGLYLHAMSQDDLLKHFRTDFKNQIIYLSEASGS